MYSPHKLWQQIETQVSEVLTVSLGMMRSQIGHLPEDYDELLLNDLLYFYIRKAFDRGIHRQLLQNLNSPNSPRNPDPDNPRSTPPIPDLSFRFADPQDLEFAHDMLRYDVECKLLGPPKSEGWKFNENYLRDGIQRFRSEHDRYGEHVPTGAMVGYIRAGQPCEEVHVEVNLQCEAHGVSLLRLIQPPGWADAHPIRLEQSFTRSYPAHEFKLLHYWLRIAPDADPSETRADEPIMLPTLRKLFAKAEQRRKSKSKAAKPKGGTNKFAALGIRSGKQP